MKITETDRGWDVLSDSGKTYEVRRETRLDEMGSMYFEMTCTCPSRKRPCKHVIAVEESDSAEDLPDEIQERIEYE